MRQATTFPECVMAVLAIAVLLTPLSEAFSLSNKAGIEPTCESKSRVLSGLAPDGLRVTAVPLKSGIWEQTLFEGKHVVDGLEHREQSCPGISYFSPFPSLPSKEHLGNIISDKVIVSDDVRRLADGRYRVTGGAGTKLGGAVTYVHLITLHGDDRYDDALTVTSHADTQPLRHTYTGSGRWVAPCPPAPQ